jgi:hypothetical protein
MRKNHRQVVRLALHAAYRRQCFAEVCLRLSSRTNQRNEHLSAVQGRRPDLVLHNRVSARELMLFF